MFEAVSLGGGDGERREGLVARRCLVSIRQVVTALTAGTPRVERGELLRGVGSLQRPVPPVLSLGQQAGVDRERRVGRSDQREICLQHFLSHD